MCRVTSIPGGRQHCSSDTDSAGQSGRVPSHCHVHRGTPHHSCGCFRVSRTQGTVETCLEGPPFPAVPCVRASGLLEGQLWGAGLGTRSCCVPYAQTLESRVD